MSNALLTYVERVKRTHAFWSTTGKKNTFVYSPFELEKVTETSKKNRVNILPTTHSPRKTRFAQVLKLFDWFERK